MLAQPHHSPVLRNQYYLNNTSVTTSQTEETSTLAETTSPFHKPVEEFSGDEPTDMSDNDTAVPTAFSLFSTERTSAPPSVEEDSSFTDQTETPSVTSIIDKTESSSPVTPIDEVSSYGQSQDTFTQSSPVTVTSSLYSTEEKTEVSQETTGSEGTEMSSQSQEPSLSPSSDVTTPISVSQSLSPDILSSVPDIEDYEFTSKTPMVESVPSISGSTLRPESPSLFTSPSTESSEESTFDFTKEFLIVSSTISSVTATESPAVATSHKTDSSETSKADVSTASSLSSTEKSISSEQHASVTTSQTEETSTLAETTSPFHKPVEEFSGDEPTDISGNDTAVPTAFSLFSTERTSAPPSVEEDSSFTDQTETPSVTSIIDKTESSSPVTPIDEVSSYGQSQDTFTQSSPVTVTSSLYSTEEQTDVSHETTGSEGTEITSQSQEPSLSPSSDVTTPISVSQSLSPDILSSVPDIEDSKFTSKTPMVESIPSISGSTLKPESPTLFTSDSTQSSEDSTLVTTEHEEVFRVQTPEMLAPIFAVSSIASTESPMVTLSTRKDEPVDHSINADLTLIESLPTFLRSTIKPTEVVTEEMSRTATQASLKISTDKQFWTTAAPESETSEFSKFRVTSFFSSNKPTFVPHTDFSESQSTFPFSRATDESQRAETLSTSQVKSSTQSSPLFMTQESTDATQVSVSSMSTTTEESGSGDFTEAEYSGDDIPLSTHDTPLETPTTVEQLSVEQTTFAKTTFKSLISSTFIEEESERVTTTATSPYTLETSQPMVIPSVTVFTTKETSAYIDMETSGMSGDDFESSSDGSGLEISIEATTKPEDEFTVATDETEIYEKVNTSDKLGAPYSTRPSPKLTQEFISSTQSPQMTSTQFTEQGSGVFKDDTSSDDDNSGLDIYDGSTTFSPVTSPTD
ncbi:hypothetical protein Q5P01_014595 [Channa striata]|uniref:Uncharacterized protein n=1 Tax=Channa striata TaxID=64152 RepID=A0AA88SL57_CHASR|nr:hypothetical protein Q5P01_014595 [Channa striata]